MVNKIRLVLLFGSTLLFLQTATILLESPSVLTTLGSDIRQQSFTKNTFTVIRAVYIFAPSSMKITPVLRCQYARRQQKPSCYASNKGRKLKYQGCHFFDTHCIWSQANVHVRKIYINLDSGGVWGLPPPRKFFFVSK